MTLIKYKIYKSTGLKITDDVQRGENHLQYPLSQGCSKGDKSDRADDQ